MSLATQEITRGSVWLHTDEEYNDPSPELIGSIIQLL